MVIKTLIIPRLNHLILSLPNPSKDFFYRFRKERKNYITFCGVEKFIKLEKNTIMQDYKVGGLKMIDIIEFKHALKSSWIRRILKQKKKLDLFIKS